MSIELEYSVDTSWNNCKAQGEGLRQALTTPGPGAAPWEPANKVSGVRPVVVDASG